MVVPSVSQQLGAIRHTIAKTILPALDPEAGFAREQAELVLASLDWTMDVVESEHRYELVEHADHRRLLAALLALGPADGPGIDTDPTTAAREALDAPCERDDLAAFRARTLALKRHVERVFGALTSNPDTELAARRLVTGVARRQTERELAWARMTGFPKGDRRPVAAVLAEQSTNTEPG